MPVLEAPLLKSLSSSLSPPTVHWCRRRCSGVSHPYYQNVITVCGYMSPELHSSWGCFYRRLYGTYLAEKEERDKREKTLAKGVLPYNDVLHVLLGEGIYLLAFKVAHLLNLNRRSRKIRARSD